MNEILYKLIRTAIDTTFKDKLPTEQEVIDTANYYRNNIVKIPCDDTEFEKIVDKIKENIVVQMDVGVVITDQDSEHASWLFSRKADIDFFFWNRYERYLSENKEWNSRVIANLGKVSDEIIDLLGDPKSTQSFQRRGLILGDVQSGKTSNYTAICNKAADVGYRVIIVLAGMMENLREQTQSRLDEEFAGRKSEYFLDPNNDTGRKNIPVGVGKYGSKKRIASFTSVTKDFDINVLKSNDLNLESVTDTVVFVVKKNKRILTNLKRWLSKSKDITGKIKLPLLVIDDEADNASVNTKSDEDPAAINKCIRALLNDFSQASYIGITATPFANIFINPNSENEMIGDDLFPRDFIYALSAPSEYIGADQLFGDDAEYKKALIPIYRDEIEEFFPYKHDKDLKVEGLPQSMHEAIAYFMLFNAIRDYRKDISAHRSMMIHVSRYTNVQNRLTDAVNEWVIQVQHDVQNYAKLQEKGREQIKNIAYLHSVWDKYNLSNISKISWNDICYKYLYKAISPIVVRAVNQKTGATSLDYFKHQKDGLRVIAVGGNSLSRGLTLEGLGVTYFYRKSLMYDTLLQMGRWFGYRNNYKDIFKIWISEEAIDWYGYITRATDELKDEIARMQLANETPKEFGLKVRQDPNSLIVTARNKMRYATKVERPVTVAGRLLETPRLKADKVVLERNREVFENFVDSLAKIGTMNTCEKQYLWNNVPKEAVSQLLRDFETDPWHFAFQGKALAEYIDNKMDETMWDVALITDGEGEVYQKELKYGATRLKVPSTERRNIIADEKRICISGTKVRVGSGGCTKIGLSKEQIRVAEKRFKEMHKDKKNVPDSAYLINRSNPLLMLHIIDAKLDERESVNKDIPRFLYALGVGFPGSESSIKTASYMVNLVELKNAYEAEEDE